MSVSGFTKYNTLYNTFLGESKDYCNYVLQGTTDLYLNYCQGAVEECFREVKYDWGNIANTNPYLFGIPHNALERIDNLHNTLKLKIESETTHIQSLIPFGARVNDKLYIKKTLLKYLRANWLSLRNDIVRLQIRLRENQLSLSKHIDRINMVSDYRDGYLSGSVGSYTIALELIPTTTNDGVSALTSYVSGHSNNVEKFISNFKGGIYPNYDKELTYSDEYLFFFKSLVTRESVPSLSSPGLRPQAQSLLRYKKPNLLDDLMEVPIPNKMGVGLSKEWKKINWVFKESIEEFVNSMLNYDTKKYNHYFNNENNTQKYLKLIKGTEPATETMSINFTGDTTQVPLVSNFFKSSVMGTANDSYNNKVERNITIS